MLEGREERGGWTRKMPLDGKQLPTVGKHCFKWAQMWRSLTKPQARRSASTLLGPFADVYKKLRKHLSRLRRIRIFGSGF